MKQKNSGCRAGRYPGSRHKGFTLVELLVTLAMAAILLSTAVPSFSSLIQNNRFTADANRFLTSMMLARSEAVKRGVTTTMAATDGADWSNGWTVQAGATVLRTEEALNPPLTLNGGRLTYQYDADGTLSGGADTLDLCDSNDTGETGRQISVAAIGHATVNAAFVCP